MVIWSIGHSIVLKLMKIELSYSWGYHMLVVFCKELTGLTGEIPVV